MLKLSGIVKDYKTGDEVVHALKGIDLEFRRQEFVSILGQSGCGKTTLLNIIGGLDKYTEGDLLINGRSTKDFKDRDWDTYRNHSIGFVFQSYNLIPHQTVLSNVELALTLSGISKSERRRRAKEALEQVGLGDQIHKKPNQMSGGQMQRVAIARALVNDPEIILADEPTGALDTETSVQIMDILKKISEDKLIIMVTHNPELAEKYSSRIIRLLDGKIISDSSPYDTSRGEEKSDKTEKTDAAAKTVKKAPKKKHSSMSLGTAFALSLNNLWTKKTRTFLTSFAGSIGIIGIALILSLSNGMQQFINMKEEEALSNYPIQIEKEATDLSALFSSFSGSEEEETTEEGAVQSSVKSNNFMTTMIDSMYAETTTNDLADLRKHIEENREELEAVTNDIQYLYSTTLNVFKSDTKDIYQVNPTQVFQSIGMAGAGDSMMGGMMNSDIWMQLPGNISTLESQYDLIDGRFPESADEAVIVTDEDGKISDFTLYTLGLLDNEDLKQMAKDIADGKELKKIDEQEYSYEELESLTFKLLLNTDFYEKNEDGTWTDKSDDKLYMRSKLSDAYEIKITGIIKAGENTGLASVGGVGYTSELMEYLVNEVNEAEIVKQQKENEDVDVFTGIDFITDEEEEEEGFSSMEELTAYIGTLPEEQQAETGGYIKQMQDSGMSEEEIIAAFNQSMKAAKTDATYEGNLELLGVSDIEDPDSIMLFPKDFDSKDKVTEFIDDYNKEKEEDSKIAYTDYIGLMMSSVTVILNAVTSVLIAFVSISLIVSSIMIAIITYISVLERTKEIGILRAMGASKKNITTIFNAEALLIGFTAGALGILISLALDALACTLVKAALDIENIAVLPVAGGVILVLISMFLSFIAGVVPARLAARKDPVIALRSE